ncbi:histidine phosphatase family protein [Propionibacteriaceae bacterium G57]|uniref:histidine phosphatase family protein n=1 Tax=Aestuariimicrobium sp. G57 TaxID=3418485 RepID=UPI003DA74CF0
MPEQTVVHLVRHGEVNNPEGVLYGRLPGFQLTERGERMADRLAAHFAGMPITYLASSPLERARQTIAPIAAKFPHLAIDIQPLVIEAANDFEGEVFGRGNKALRDPRKWWRLRNPLLPSWGEPYQEVAERMLLAVHEAAEAIGPGRQGIIVSHQLPIWITRLHVEGRRLPHDPRRRRCTLASVTSLHLVGGRVVRVEYAEPAIDLIPPKDRTMNLSVAGGSSA